MTAARGVAFGALGVAALVVIVLLLSGGSTHTYKLDFQNAGQIVKGDDVQIGGRRVGNVDKIELTSDNQAEITVSVEDGFAPLHQGTTAVIRATSLSGIANRYIALTPGANNLPQLADGAKLTAEKTTAPVDLDQLFNTFDPATRKALQNVIQGSSAWYDGKGAQANRGSKYFNPGLATTAKVVTEIAGDQQAFTDFVVKSSQLVTALDSRRSTLTNLVTNTNTTAGAIASENSSLSSALGVLPSTLRKANTTFVNLRATLNDLDPLVAASKPATKHLGQFLRELRPLVSSARPTIHDLRTLIRRSGANNDLIDLLGQAPGLEKAARPSFAHSITALQKSEPVLRFIRPYTPDLVGWFRDFGIGTSNYDANGHFARIQPIFNAFDLNDQVLAPSPTLDRALGIFNNHFKPCPDATSQPPADGSGKFRDSDGKLDCDPNQVIPG
jgi:phospholipid/cholesterol/gamma-HCH transport system substrate-binding protein